MGHNDPRRLAAIAANLKEHDEESIAESSWHGVNAQLTVESEEIMEELEYLQFAFRICGEIRRRGENPAIWWESQTQGSYYSRKLYKAVCDTWKSKFS
ncbi:hypothetical protein KC953_02455 [Candidatus Saccharibacteria bacterium]|nr:hypothetical protein [Candidatus Saccharibacteria bacterium]